MAYKQKGCTPVTAKVQKTTKGGMVQQPLLNMGAPVKMKSPAKQSGRPRVEAKAEEPKNNKGQIDKLKLEISSMTDTLENYKKKGGKIVASDANYLQKKKEELASLSPKNNTKKDIAIEKVAGGYFGNTLGKIDFPIKPKKDNNKDPNRIDFPMKPKKDDNKDNKKETVNVIKRKKVEAIKPNVEAKTVSMETKSEIVLPKKAVEVKNIEKAEKKIDIAENKETRAAKVRAKGEKSLAEGNKDKALRLKRREERILKRAQKKRSQASKAIEPN